MITTGTTHTEHGYCFAHRARSTFTVEHHTDGQETVACNTCHAVGYGPIVTPAPTTEHPVIVDLRTALGDALDRRQVEIVRAHLAGVTS